jgi:molybdopterin/thiamine biosynthesis adenylyltransferase
MAPTGLESKSEQPVDLDARDQEPFRVATVKLRFATEDWQLVRGLLRDDGVESSAVCLAEPVAEAEMLNLIVRDVRLPHDGHYRRRGPFEAELTPEYVASVVREARDRKCSVVFCHTHPFAQNATFSETDWAGEQVLRQFIERRIPGVPHAALVISRDSASCRLVATDTFLRVYSVGRTIECHSSLHHRLISPADPSARFDRQLRAFGKQAQRELEGLYVAIIGAGGTGSVMAEQLAHLGVSHFLIVDPDVLDLSNLNRVVGATHDDVGRPKVEVAAELVRRINPAATVEALHGSVLNNTVVGRIRFVDAILCCTDSHGSRYVINEVAYRFLVPTFDCGVAIVAQNETLTHVSGRAQMLAPGLACLNCLNTLDPELVRRDLLTDFERARDPYIIGGTEPQPAVISINGVVVSLAVTMFLGAFARFPVMPRHQRYDCIRGVVRVIDNTALESCVTCSRRGALGVGDSWPLPGRPA